MLGMLKKIFDPNHWELKKLQKWVDKINEIEPEIKKLSDEELKNKTPYFKEQLKNGKFLDDILPEAFAVVRETSIRTLGMRHYDVQLIGGVVLHQGRISEMKTGEGKTLVATLPMYLNALEGKGAHLITVNDYLAKRDARWMGPIYHFLGLSVGVIQHDLAFIYEPDYIVGDESLDQLKVVSRREAYAADITYGTNNEFGFDYLRDNMVMETEDRVQGELNYAIVDEVDSILIDEARTPLIISGRGERSSDNYQKFARIASRLKINNDYKVYEKEHSVSITEEGARVVENYLGLKRNVEDPENSHPLYNQENTELVHYLESALKAKELYKRDVDYVLKDGEVIIIDEFTGRPMFGRRYSDGLHQSIEAKENVKVRSEDQTLATITFQNYFRMYKKLSGMTGTAVTEEKEFRQIYNTDVVVIPTHRSIARKDLADRIYKSEESKIRAIVNEIDEFNKNSRPVLVGTRSIEKSELFSKMLKKKKIKHNVLNAKYHEKEAHIIAQAGEPGAVTIATNMAGRGVDIILGGTPPTDEREKRTYESAKSHLEKITNDLDKLRELKEDKLVQRDSLQEKCDKLQKKITQIRKENKTNHSESLAKEIEEIRKEIIDTNEKLRDIKGEISNTEKAIKGHVELLPQVKDKLNESCKAFDKRKETFPEEEKEWKVKHHKVIKAGGLCVIGTERHESRRIDNQLRGRAGRQGDPGTTRFYSSLEDELLRLFGSDRLPDWLTNWDDDQDIPLEHNIITKYIQKAQEKVESYHFDMRKSVLDYDNVMNEQRKIIYSERARILKGENLKPHIQNFINEYIDRLIILYAPDGIMFEEWDLKSLYKTCKEIFIPLPFEAKVTDLAIPNRSELKDKIVEWANYAYNEKEKKLGDELMRLLERWVLLQVVDTKWMDHLQTMDDLREGIGLRAYGQRDPLIEYIRESNDYFEVMKEGLKEETIKYIFRVQVKSEGIQERAQRKSYVTREHRGQEGSFTSESGKGTTIRRGLKVGRNDPCPCGSGKKYKKCCGRKS